MRSRYKIVDNEHMHFITSTVVEWIPVFRNFVFMDKLVDSINYCIQNKDLKVYCYVILDDHFHLLVKSPDITKTMKALKGYTARQIIDTLIKSNNSWLINQLSHFKKRFKKESSYQLWQEGFHPESILTDHMLRQKIDYIHNNPVKRGLVRLPEHWRYSSAGYYLCGEKPDIMLTDFD